MSSVAEQTAAAAAAWMTAWSTGPVRTRWETLPVQVGDSAPDLGLRTSDGDAMRLSELWSAGPALLLFWRHFGCGCGLARAERLETELAEYTAAGAVVAVIGQAEPERSSAYREQVGLRCLMLCDPQRMAYRAFGLLDGDAAQILYDAPDALQRRDREAGRRFAAGRSNDGRPPVDSPWQMPGEFVVDGSGKIRLAYRYQYCEDFPDPRVLATAIRLGSTTQPRESAGT